MKLFLVIASLALGSVAGLRTDVSMMARRGGGRAAAIPKSKVN
jgi:hypothetical protein